MLEKKKQMNSFTSWFYRWLHQCSCHYTVTINSLWGGSSQWRTNKNASLFYIHFMYQILARTEKENSIKFWYDLDNFYPNVKNMAYTLIHLVICHISLLYSSLFFFFYNPRLFTNKKGGWWVISGLILIADIFKTWYEICLDVKICEGDTYFQNRIIITGYQERCSVWEIKYVSPSEIRYF